VAGKVVKIPVFLSQKKKIWFNARFIFQSLKEKSELTFLDKLINELLQIVKKKGNTLKKYSDFQKDIKLLLPNNRFIDK
jgi:ribosomal protein S7